MSNKTVMVMVACVMLGMPSIVFADTQEGGKRFILNLLGSGDMYERLVPDIDGDGIDDPAMCFDVDVVNAKNRRTIGSGTDCLSTVRPIGTGLALVGTTFFHLKKGTLVVRGPITVQPVLHPTVTPNGVTITHVTGASSDGNAIIEGTRRFSNKTGSARLSGMVDMANFAGNVGDPIVFDCLFVIDLD